MKKDTFGIATGGETRLYAAIEAQVRREFESELSAATTDSERAAVEEKIQRKIKAEMKRIASPYSLWGSP